MRFSICIPQYNRTDFLLRVLDSLAAQSFRDFEICVSDDCSSDGRQAELRSWLEASGIDYQWHGQIDNLRYDANLRAAMDLARGEFLFLLGNDDALLHQGVLHELDTYLNRYGNPALAICNYSEYVSGKIVKRVQEEILTTPGVESAVSYFRDFSFVSGVVFRRDKYHQHRSGQYDGSEMYQMCMAASIMSAGGSLLRIPQNWIKKDIQIDGQNVDSYRNQKERISARIESGTLPLLKMPGAVVRSIRTGEPQAHHNKVVWSVFWQIYLYTWAFWLVEYRRVFGMALSRTFAQAIHPNRQPELNELSFAKKSLLAGLHWSTSVAAQIIPMRAISAMLPALHRIAKGFRR